MVSCVVISCKTRSEKSSIAKDGVSFHTFPKHPLLRTQWTNFCRRLEGWTPKRSSVVCSHHFNLSDFEVFTNEHRRRLKENAVPSIFRCDCKKHDVPKSELNGTFELVILSEASDSVPTSAPQEELRASTSPSRESSEIPPRPSLDIQTPRERKLKRQLLLKNIQIKRLHAKIRYLSSKVNDLQELLGNLS